MKAGSMISLFWLFFLIARAQTDSLRWQRIIHEQDSMDVRWKKQMDSLSHDFYAKPKYFDLKLEINGKQKRIKNEKFIVSINQKETEIKPDSAGKYFMNFQVDSEQSIILKLLSNNLDIEVNLKGHENEQLLPGAKLIFGEIKDIYKQSRRGLRKPKDDDHELSKSDERYNSILTNERFKAGIANRKINAISYVHITPRVFGCGMESEYLMYK